MYNTINTIVYIAGILFLICFARGFYIGAMNSRYKRLHKNHINGIYDINCKLCREEIEKFNNSNIGWKK